MMFQIWYNFTRFFYYPLFVWLLPLFSKKVSSRLKFEKKNFSEKTNISFKKESLKADFAFEVSSEGELEQVRAILENLLNQKFKVELIYCSESVEKQCEALAEKFSDQLRVIRMPLITYFPFGKGNIHNWLSAPVLFLCRYDFFPELIFYGRKANHQLVLLSGTMKNFDIKASNFIIKWYYNYVYKSFNKVVMSTSLDKELVGKTFNIENAKIEAYDFRPIQIYKRLSNKTSALHDKFPHFSLFDKFLQTIPKDCRLIFGSFWNDEKIINKEISLLLKEKMFMTIVPHKLDEESIEQIKETINRYAPEVNICEIHANISLKEMESLIETLKNQPAILILNLKGILCELYSYFGHAYVAGGYRLSVHSLMEPYLAECMIYCGPKIHRSTEYDLIRQSNPDRIKLIENSSLVLKEIRTTDLNKLSSMSSFKSHYEGHFEPLLFWLGLKTYWGHSDA